jgi:predicted HicB family RNase H-like nuclease
MKDMLKYKGYYGSIHFDEDDLILFGKAEFVKALISYEGESAAEIKQAFEEAVDDYLLMCEKEKITPEKPFKGTFNVRIGEALHERAVIAATGMGIKLNEFVKQALEHELRT